MNQKGFSPIILILIIVIVAGGAFLIGQSSVNKSKNLENITVTSPDPDQTANWSTYSNEKYGFSFKYPKLDDSCCNISGPSSESAEEIIVLADKSTTMEGTDKPFNGLAMYVDPNPTNMSFSDYVKNEKNILIKHKEAFTGDTDMSEGTESNITVAGQEGIMLDGYSWDSIKRIYVPMPDSQNILVISKMDESKGSFNAVFSQILNTFKFSK